MFDLESRQKISDPAVAIARDVNELQREVNADARRRAEEARAEALEKSRQEAARHRDASAEAENAKQAGHAGAHAAKDALQNEAASEVKASTPTQDGRLDILV